MEELKHSKYVGRLILNHATFDLYECCFTMKHSYETDSRNQNAKFWHRIYVVTITALMQI
jgi:hypothetical protein